MIFVSFSLKLVSFMPNLRRLTTSTFPETLNTRLLLRLDNLTSLKMLCDPQTIRALSFVGHRLKELHIAKAQISHENTFFDVLKVFVYCPNLEYFVLLRFKGVVDFSVLVDPKNLKLRKLVVEGCFQKAQGFLPLICSAPLLEEVDLWVYCTKDDITIMATYLLLEDMFKGLIKVKLAYRPIDGVQFLRALECLAKMIVAFCPKLETTNFEFDTQAINNRTQSNGTNQTENSSVAPFVNLVRSI